MRKFDVAFDVNISQRHKLRLGPFMRDGAHLCYGSVRSHWCRSQHIVSFQSSSLFHYSIYL